MTNYMELIMTNQPFNLLILSHVAMILGMTEPQSQHEHMHHAMEAGR